MGERERERERERDERDRREWYAISLYDEKCKTALK